MKEVHEFLAQYNGITKPCGKFPRTASEGCRREVRAYLAFCEKENVDPVRLCRARHEAIEWKARIPIKRLTNTTDHFLGHFRTWGSMRQRQALANVVPVEDLTGLSPMTELYKRTHLMEPELCMTGIDMSRGWNPESEWCQRCPIAERCERALHPDVRRSRRQ